MKARREGHASPENYLKPVYKGLLGVFLNKDIVYNPLQSIKMTVDSFGPKWIITKFVDCKCAGSGCEQGLMTKYTVELDKNDLAEIVALSEL